MIPEGFHFLRPYWLLALLPVALLLWAGTRAAAQGSAWRRVVDAHLLRHLLVTSDGATRRWPLAAAAAGLVAACVALAGPTWERIPQPTFAALDPTVVVLDMSPAMEARDVTPSRLARARHELQDVLARSRGGQVGLVLYADEPFVAVPLTDDARVIEELIPSLERGLMPPRPARTDRAIAQAAALLEQAGVPSGRIVLLTADAGALPDPARAAASSAAARGHTVSVLGVGVGAEQAPARGVPALDRTALEALAAAGGGRFAEIRPDDSDVAALLPLRAAPGGVAAQSGSSAQADAWRDAGVWLVLVPLLLGPLAFRRGLVIALALALLAAAATPSEAGIWADLWSRRDQQAQAALQRGDATTAAELFEDRAWQAAARYESGAFAESIAAYRALPGDDNRYNLGNALARAGQLEEALAAYDEVLERAPQHEDARFNRDLVQRLLDQQRQQHQQQQGQSGQPDEQRAGAQREPQQGGGADEEQQQGDGGDDAQHESASEDAASREERSAGASDAQQEEHAQQPAAQPQPGRESPTEGGEAQASGSPQDEAPPQDEQRQAGAAQPEQGSGDAEPESDPAADTRDDAAAQDDRTLAERLTQALGGDAERKEHADTANEPHDAGETANEAHGATASATEPAQPLDERAQAREQMLRSIPDDPGGLLRAKIRRRYAERRYAGDESTPYAPEETTPW